MGGGGPKFLKFGNGNLPLLQPWFLLWLVFVRLDAGYRGMSVVHAVAMVVSGQFLLFRAFAIRYAIAHWMRFGAHKWKRIRAFKHGDSDPRCECSRGYRPYCGQAVVMITHVQIAIPTSMATAAASATIAPRRGRTTPTTIMIIQLRDVNISGIGRFNDVHHNGTMAIG